MSHLQLSTVALRSFWIRQPPTLAFMRTEPVHLQASPRPAALPYVRRHQHLARPQATSKELLPEAITSGSVTQLSWPKFLQAVELFSLALAAGLQACTLVIASNQETYEVESCQNECYHAEPTPLPAQHTCTDTMWLSHFAIGALILAYIFGLLARMLFTGR